MKKFQFKWFAKNVKRRRIVVGALIGVLILAAVIITAIYMDAVMVTLHNSNPEAGSLLGGGLITNGSSITIRAQENPGYVFTNWTNVDGTIASTEKVHRLSVPESGLELTANWKITDWYIFLNIDAADKADPESEAAVPGFNPDKFTAKSDTIYLDPPTKEGYTFLGWYKDPEYKESAPDYIQAGTAKNVTLYAKWAPSYNIVYHSGDTPDNSLFSNNSDNPSTYTAEADVILEIPTCYELKDGKQTGGTYNFLGWYTAAGTKVDKIYAVQKEDIELFAHWDKSAPSYYSVFKKGKYTYVDIGRYPQHILDDPAILAGLKKAIASSSSPLLPDPETGYYSYNGIQYAKITADPYQKSTYFSDGTEVKKGKEFFFIVEPITWRVLSGNPDLPGSELLLMAEDVLSAGLYRSSKVVRSYQGETVYANNWEKSDIRSFLNGEFYSRVFMEGERTLVQLSNVDFSKKTSHFERFANGKTCDDYVFLLSYADMANRKYNWDHWTRTADSRKVGKATDYAKAMGVYASLNRGGEYDSAHWWLRSSGDFEARAALTTALGTVGTYEVDCKAIGIRPAIKVVLKKA